MKNMGLQLLKKYILQYKSIKIFMYDGRIVYKCIYIFTSCKIMYLNFLIIYCSKTAYIVLYNCIRVYKSTYIALKELISL